MKNIKVENVDFFEKIPNGVTLQIMEHISKLSFVKYPCAKLSKRKLQKAEFGVVRFLQFFGQFLIFLKLIPNVVTPRISEQLSEFRLVQ